MADNGGGDLILDLEHLKMPQGPGGQAQSFLNREVAQAKPVFEWLSNEGVNWEAARVALDSPETMKNLKPAGRLQASPVAAPASHPQETQRQSEEAVATDGGVLPAVPPRLRQSRKRYL